MIDPDFIYHAVASKKDSVLVCILRNRTAKELNEVRARTDLGTELDNSIHFLRRFYKCRRLKLSEAETYLVFDPDLMVLTLEDLGFFDIGQMIKLEESNTIITGLDLYWKEFIS